MQTTALRCRIRAMRTEDIPQVIDIERQSFPTMWPQAVYQRELKNKMARYLIAYTSIEEAEELGLEPPPSAGPGIGGMVKRFFGGLPVTAPRDLVLGCIGLWLLVDEAHIVTIAVREQLRRRGLGELLLLAGVETALATHQHELTLEYRISNVAARALYEKYGFRQVGVRNRYYSDNHEDAVLMTTPPLRSPQYLRLVAERVAKQRLRWGAAYPLDGALRQIERNAR